MHPTVILATLGTLGDLHPFIALGLALKSRDVTVLLACASDYRDKVETAGLAWRQLRPNFADFERDLGMDREQLTHAVLTRPDFLLRKLIMPQLRAAYADMLTILPADLVVGSSLAFGARLAAEQRGIPWIAAVLQPLMFVSAYDPPQIPQADTLSRLLRRLGPRPARWLLQLAKYAVGTQLVPVHRLRREVGLAATRLNPLFEGQYSSLGTLALYSPLIGGAQPDHPERTSIVGFASFDSEQGGVVALEASLQKFLDCGEPPLVFTLGSLIVNAPGSFYRESLAAARILNLRAVLLVGAAARAAYAGGCGADVLVCAYAPHSLLFPRAAAIVHQGGIGTLAQALRSGRPQLVVPFYADQFDNAARAVRLGVARSLRPKSYDASSAARELRHLTTRMSYAMRAREVGRIVTAEDGAARGAEFIMDRLTSLPVR